MCRVIGVISKLLNGEIDWLIPFMACVDVFVFLTKNPHPVPVVWGRILSHCGRRAGSLGLLCGDEQQAQDSSLERSPFLPLLESRALTFLLPPGSQRCPGAGCSGGWLPVGQPGQGCCLKGLQCTALPRRLGSRHCLTAAVSHLVHAVTLVGDRGHHRAALREGTCPPGRSSWVPGGKEGPGWPGKRAHRRQAQEAGLQPTGRAGLSLLTPLAAVQAREPQVLPPSLWPGRQTPVQPGRIVLFHVDGPASSGAFRLLYTDSTAPRPECRLLPARSCGMCSDRTSSEGWR